MVTPMPRGPSPEGGHGQGAAQPGDGLLHWSWPAGTWGVIAAVALALLVAAIFGIAFQSRADPGALPPGPQTFSGADSWVTHHVAGSGITWLGVTELGSTSHFLATWEVTGGGSLNLHGQTRAIVPDSLIGVALDMSRPSHLGAVYLKLPSGSWTLADAHP